MSDTFDKKPLNEEETKLQLITPAIEKAGWDKKRIRMEWSYTDGEIIVRDNSKHRGKKKKVDYVLLSDDNYPKAKKKKPITIKQYKLYLNYYSWHKELHPK